MQIKVLFVRSGNGGIDPITTNQGKSLAREGIELEYFDIIGKGIFGYLSNIKKLRKRIKCFRPDLIHCHYSLSCFLASLTLSGKPIIASLMGSDIYSSNKIKLVLIKLLSRFYWKSTIVKSEDLFKKLGIGTAEIIPNGVNYDDFKLVNKNDAMSILGWDSKQYHILFASDPLRPEKNFQLANIAVKRLIEKNINVETHFLTGIEFSKMVLYYCAADVLLMTSLYEGSPNVIKEAMVCNCPIVTTDVGDVKEILNKINGSFIVGNNEELVEEGLVKALNFNSRTNGRESIRGLESSLIASRLIKLYETLLSSN